MRALIFDFDGVLADTEELHRAAFDAVASTLGGACSRADYYGRFLGLPDRDCLAALCAQVGVTPDAQQLDLLVASKRQHFAQLSHTAVLYPGVPETLRRLHQHFLLAIASGAFRDEINAILERHQVRSLFRAVVAMEDVRAGKPAPDPYLQALRALGKQTAAPLSAAHCVVIEDSPHGITAAHAAGMRCVGVTTHHDRTVLAAADAIIASVAELRHEAGD